MLYHTHRDQNTMLQALKDQYKDTFINIRFSHNEDMSRYYTADCVHNSHENVLLKVSYEEYDSFLKTHISNVSYQSTHVKDEFISI